MVVLTEDQLQEKIEFFEKYIAAENAADGSAFDANANVSSKNIATLETEINKDFNIQINRELMRRELKELYGDFVSEAYIAQIEKHEIYPHDETHLKPYCTSVTMYPLLFDGLTKLGGESKASNHLASFCGNFVNFVFATSSQFAGAVATVEFLMYFDHFARLDYGDNYLITHERIIKESLQHVVYTINQPAAARGYQAVFWNISIYDKPYFDAMFGNFMFPAAKRRIPKKDWFSKLKLFFVPTLSFFSTKSQTFDDFIKMVNEDIYEEQMTEMMPPNWDTFNELQKYFMRWFNKERTISILTYPVVTAACLTDGKEMVDKEFENFISQELSEGNSFFVFMSENAHALSSCCRLKNDVSDSINDFSYSLGAGGVSTGSINVITMNLNRLIQDCVNSNTDIFETVKKQTQLIHKYQIAYRKIMEERFLNKRMLPVYDAGFIQMDKQFLTIGINGLVEGAEFLGYDISVNDDYMNFVSKILKTISDENKVASKETGYKFNTEFVPAENLGVKFSKWDKKDCYFVPRDCYNSYMYKVEDEEIAITEKFVLHGKEFMQYLDGGSAYHCNLDQTPDKGTFKQLLKVAATTGCEYFCFNIKITICNECENIDKRTLQACPKCGTKNIDWGTRVIGYLKRISAFSKPRQIEESKRNYRLKSKIEKDVA